MSADGTPHVALCVVKYFEHGGMQRTFMRIARELLRRGCRVTALAATWEGAVPDGLEVETLPVSQRTNHGRNQAFGDAVCRWRAGQDVDVLVGFNKIPHLDIYYAGDPCYAEVIDTRPLGFLQRLTPRYRTLKKLEESVFGAGRTTEVLLIAPAEKARFQRHYGTEERRLHLLPPGIDRERLERQLGQVPHRSEFISSLGLDPADKLLLIVGSGFHTKGVDRAIHAVAALSGAADGFYSLAVVGEGDPASFKTLARRLGLGARCVFTGPRQDVVSFYRHSELLIHPARLENTGTTLIEAMYCGLPVVVQEGCGFAHHVLQAQAGLVVPEPFDQRIFDGMVLSALMAPQRDAWCRNGPAYCKRENLYGLIEEAADIICGYRSKA